MKPSVLSTLLPVLHRAQTGAAAEVSDDHAPVGDLRRNLRQDRGDVLVRQAVEAVALHTGRADLARQRHELGDGRLAAMEARVEAGDLRHAGQPLRDRVNRREIVRLVERRERYQRAQLVEHLRRDDRRGRQSAARRGRRGGRRRGRGRRRTSSAARRRAHRAPSGRRARPSCRGLTSASRAPEPSFAENRGDVPIPSICPRASSRHASASGRR